MEFSKQQLADMLEKMYRTRKFEEKIAYFFAMGMVHGTTHLCAGQEAVATGVVTAMNEQDIMTSTHRGHGHCISKELDLNLMMAEFLGKETGYCKGKGGSMHIADLDSGNLGANGIVGGGHCVAVGAALTSQMKKQNKLVICFFGDGAINEGSWHEAANLASVWKLPVLFVCENNQYGMSMSKERSMNIDDIAVRANAFGFPGKTIDGNNVIEIYKETRKAREYVMENGPMLLVCNTYRFYGHSKSDANVYRTKAEIEEWKSKDPILQMRAFMLDNGFTETELDEIDKKAAEDIESAVEFAQASPYPSIDTIMDDVYA